MTKEILDKERVQHVLRKHLGYMTPQQLEEVEITDSGLEYKGNLMVAYRGLRSSLIVKETPVEVIEPVVVEEKVETETPPPVVPKTTKHRPKK